MTPITVGTTPTLIAAAGHRDFIHIFNNSSQPIYVVYDGSEGAAGANLTTANGVPIGAGGNLLLDNVGPRILFNKAVYGIVAAGSSDVRAHGV